ncbi:MAG: lipopolysaccharide biosynthesis protein [Acidimicrobiales bacterium]|nr:lipopolysaccharide biosynthesis protein [Acidimicrobiales bacterium]
MTDPSSATSVTTDPGSGGEHPPSPDGSSGPVRRTLRDRATGRHRHLLAGSSVLVVGAAVQGVGGMLFSLIAAQLDTKAQFGDATALYTSTMFVVYLAGLGLPVAVARYAADRSDDSHTVFTWGALATAAASIVTSALYLGIVHPPAANVLWDWQPVLGFGAFVLIVMGSAWSLIIDVRAMTMRRWGLVLFRILAVSILKVALIYIGQASDHRSLLLFAYLGGPVALSGFVGMALINRTSGGRHRLSPRPAHTRDAVRYAGINYLSTLAYQAPYFALPVIVLVNVSSVTNSSFYVAWGIVSIAFYVPSAIGQALLAEGGKDGAQVAAQMKLALVLAIGLMAVGALVTFAGKSVVVAAYGEGYRDAAEILPAMMLAGVPWALTSLFLSEARILHRHAITVIITVTLTVAIIGPALVLVPDHGIEGARSAWLGGNVLAAVVATALTLGARRTARRANAPLLDPVALAADQH